MCLKMRDFLTKLFNHTAFIIYINGDKVICKHGKAERFFIQACHDIAKQNGITKGRIVGIQMLNNVKLKFCDDIPPNLHQRFRNSLAFR